jgi:hypothetical protein
MHFFLVDFALAFVALLGYRAVAAVTRDRVAAMALGGRLYPRPAPRGDKRMKTRLVLPKRPLRHEFPFSHGGGGTMACCGERAPHRLINFW